MRYLLGTSLDELVDCLQLWKQHPYRATQILKGVYERRLKSFDAITDLPKSLRDKLTTEFQWDSLSLIREVGSKDATRKFLFALPDGQRIETVQIPASPALYGERADRRTLCVSTQVGCAYGCKFCASGLNGWKRNLQASEIVAQLLIVEDITGQRINNVVFMGMGEPFANYDHVMRAITILNAPWGVGLGARHFTVSTSGIVPRIRDFADQPLQLRLAISLHGATDEVRQRIMPINKKYPLKELLDACAYYSARKKQMLTFEFILIANVNDSLEQAALLAKYARRLQAKVNLIPYNRVEGLDWERPDERTQNAFRSILVRAGVPVTLRREKGHDIAAACGQLRLSTPETTEKPLPS